MSSGEREREVSVLKAQWTELGDGLAIGEGNRHFSVSASVAEGVVGLFTRGED